MLRLHEKTVKQTATPHNSEAQEQLAMSQNTAGLE